MAASYEGYGLSLGHVRIQLRNLVKLGAELLYRIEFSEYRLDFLNGGIVEDKVERFCIFYKHNIIIIENSFITFYTFKVVLQFVSARIKLLSKIL